MKFYELRVTLFFKQDIHFKDIGEKLSIYVNYCMSRDGYLREAHSKHTVKLYGYSFPYPFEADKVYKANRIYQVKLRTPVYEIAAPFVKLMNQMENDCFKAMGCQMEVREPKYIEIVETTTPAVVTLGNKYWTKEEGMDLLFDKIHNNLVKKYNLLNDTNETFDINSVEFIEVGNERPIIMNYKGGKVFGHKLMVRFKQDERSQVLAKTAVACSLLEKNSALGTGFCLYNKRR